MPQVAFFVGSAAAGIGGVAILMAWDRHDRGQTAADDIAIDDVALYSWIAPLVTAGSLIKMKTKSPISVPEENCPKFPDGAPDADYVVRFEVKPGGTALGSVADFSLDIFDNSNRIYGVAPQGQAIKFDLSDNSFLPNGVSIQDRPTLQPWEDPLEGLASIMNLTVPTKEIWRALMTPNQPVEWFA